MRDQTHLTLTFAHRKNVDGTFDSICLYCYLTVGREHSEPKLKAHEDEHHCIAVRQGPYAPDSPEAANEARDARDDRSRADIVVRQRLDEDGTQISPSDPGRKTLQARMA